MDYMTNDKYNLGSYCSSLSIMVHPGKQIPWDASLNISYLYWMVIYKERHVAELVKIIQVRYTINSYSLLLSRKNYMLRLVSTFLLIRRKDLFSIEDLCSLVSHYLWIIFVAYLT
jgi:hypothetical protein